MQEEPESSRRDAPAPEGLTEAVADCAAIAEGSGADCSTEHTVCEYDALADAVVAGSPCCEDALPDFMELGMCARLDFGQGVPGGITLKCEKSVKILCCHVPERNHRGVEVSLDCGNHVPGDGCGVDSDYTKEMSLWSKERWRSGGFPLCLCA